jgi:hypothetical protein
MEGVPASRDGQSPGRGQRIAWTSARACGDWRIHKRPIAWTTWIRRESCRRRGDHTWRARRVAVMMGRGGGWTFQRRWRTRAKVAGHDQGRRSTTRLNSTIIGSSGANAGGRVVATVATTLTIATGHVVASTGTTTGGANFVGADLSLVSSAGSSERLGRDVFVDMDGLGMLA